MTLGQLFKDRRSELGRSLEQISAATKIHTKILTALENDEYADLPARTFTRGFIVTYSKALRLDSEQVLKDYHDFLESKFAERSDRDKGHQGYVFEGKELEQNKRWMVIGATLAALFAISVLLIFKPQNHHRNEKHKEFAEEDASSAGESNEGDIPTPAINTADKSAVPVSVANKPTSTSSPIMNLNASVATSSVSPKASATSALTSAITSTPAPTAAPTATKAAVASTPAPAASASPAASNAIAAASASPSPTPKEDKLNKGDDITSKEVKRRVLFEAIEDSWVRYQVDQKPVMTIILRKGRQLVVKAKESIRVETNNSANLRYKTRNAQYVNLDQAQFSVEGDGTLKAIDAGSIAPKPLPILIPDSPNP